MCVCVCVCVCAFLVVCDKYNLSSLLQGGLVIRQLHVPRGMLSGFGRRVSSLFFSTQVQDFQETRRLETAYSEASQKE